MTPTISRWLAVMLLDDNRTSSGAITGTGFLITFARSSMAVG